MSEEEEREEKTFSSLLLFRVFLSPLLLIPQQYSTFELCLLGLLLNNNKYVLLLLRINPGRQHSKGLYRWGSRERKDTKEWRSRSEEKVVGFSSASLFYAGKREAVTQGGTREIDHWTRRRTQGHGTVKCWEDKTHSRYIHVKQE